MNKKDLKAIQQISKEILFEIVDICERNDIEYFLMFGTLLGAVRHGGFIPWDDDVDLGMTRKNYMKFLKIAKEQLSDSNELIVMGSADTISEIKIGRKGTLYCLRDAASLNIASEITVDIFLLDYIKIKPEWKKKIQHRLIRGLRICSLNWDEKRLLFISINKSSHRFKFVYKAALLGMHGLRCLLGEDGINKIIYDMCVDKSGTSGRIANVFSPDTITAHYRIIKLPFEGRMLSAMDIYDDILRKDYGDYMTLPPENKRYNSHMKDWILKIN